MWVFRLWKCIDMSAGKVEDEMLEWATHTYKAFVWPTFFFIQSATLLECIRKLKDFKFESEPACIIKPGHEHHLIQFKLKQKVCHWKEFWQRFFFFSMIIPKRSWNKPITRSCLAKRIRKTRYAIGATSKFHESLHLVIYCPYWVKNLWNNRMNQPFTVNCLLRESFTSFVNVTRIHWTTCCVLGANAKLQCIYQEKLNSTSVCAKHFWLAVQYFSLTNFPSQALWQWGLYGKPSSK